PLLREAPVVGRMGMVEPDVRSGSHQISARSQDAMDLAHRAPRVVAMLEHLRAQHEIEALRRKTGLLRGADEISARTWGEIERANGIAASRQQVSVRRAVAAEVERKSTGRL